MFWDHQSDSRTPPPRNTALRGGIMVSVVIVALMVTALGSFIAGYFLGSPTQTSGGSSLIAEAWTIIERAFYKPLPNGETRARAAIHGMIGTLNDKYTMLLEPVAAETEVRVMQGALGGIGVRIAPTAEGEIEIVEALLGWYAAQAGIRAGDVIIAVNGTPVKGMETNAAADMIRGELGTTVTLTIRRKEAAAPFEVIVTRGQINVYGTILEGTDIAYIGFDIFNQTAPADIRRELERLLPLNPRALIFDMRANPGGWLDGAIDIADLFLPEGLVATEKVVSGEVKRFTSKSGEIAESIALIVLVNGNSASAAEVVAGALKDRGRAMLIGGRTFGKGSVQTIYRLSDGSQLRVTSGAWYTPNETPLEASEGNAGGLMPDLAVSVPDGAKEDVILKHAIAYIYATVGAF